MGASADFRVITMPINGRMAHEQVHRRIAAQDEVILHQQTLRRGVARRRRLTTVSYSSRFVVELAAGSSLALSGASSPYRGVSRDDRYAGPDSRPMRKPKSDRLAQPLGHARELVG